MPNVQRENSRNSKQENTSEPKYTYNETTITRRSMRIRKPDEPFQSATSSKTDNT